MPEILLLGVVLIIFLVPSLLQLRRQQRVITQRRALQASLQIDEQVVVASGLHGRVVAVREHEVDLEIAPGTVTTWDIEAVVRRVEPQVERGEQAAEE
ncbi:preprotein translocase subunit YajC [Corynebacterium canis]|uniref:Preprotein translocase subunit YajC n=1 Tax=Corynebacterium canis TaxID=679663 RepID=A0A5C5UFG4_9CORY|nr:preprotein translocase subunit YajC [Corynebacterium canis]TWT24557.1 preprotein translocase subunit YajC [Corynebacterium canis]WJY75435.1 preprotein translocase subunit YajC [Corynebacterium canis]